MKKRFIALALIFILALSFASCDISSGSQDVGEISSKIIAMYNRSTPTKSVTTMKSESAGVLTIDEITITSGKIDGNLDAATYKAVQQRFNTVSSGSNAMIIDPVGQTPVEKEYIKGMGVRIKGGTWDPTADSFAPTDGSLGLNVTDSTISNVKEEGKTISFTVVKANTQAVFGMAINADVSVVIKHDGASIVAISLSYVEPAVESADPMNEPDMPETQFSIEIKYSYDIEKINIGVR